MSWLERLTWSVQPSDVLAILEALKVAGALHGELIII